MLEDVPTDAELVLLELKKGKFDFLHKCVDNRKSFIDALNEFNPDIILADYHLPQFDGISALKLKKEILPDRPFIFVSGAIGEEIAIKMLKAGATDYILKDRLSRLVPAVKRALNEAEEYRKRKKAESELKLLVAGIENAADGLIITNREGIIEYMNPAFEDITGYSPEDVIGKKPSILKSGQHSRGFYKHMWDTIISGKSWHGLLTNKKKNGEFYQDRTTISPVINDENEIAHFVSLKRDVTREKKLEEQLFQAVKMESIGKLAGGIAHDFNNLLTIINGYTEAMLFRVTDEKIKEDLNQILKAGNKAARLIEKIMAFSHEQTTNAVILNMNDVITDVEKMAQRIIGENIELSINLDPQLYDTLIDPSQLEQILMNLIVNAKDALPNGGTITVSTRNQYLDKEFVQVYPWAKEGDFVELSISDTGVGIDNAILDKIFDPFFTTKKKGEGTGLGLSTAYGIVKQNNGNILVYSEPGTGTSFKIYFPRLHRKEKNVEEVEHSAEFNIGGRTVLIAEDESGVRHLAEELFRSSGFKVISVVSGEDAVDMAKSYDDSIDLLFTDMVMKGMNGIETASRIKEFYPDIKVLFSSGYPKDHIKQFETSGIDFNFVKKPYSQRTLLEILQEIFT